MENKQKDFSFEYLEMIKKELNSCNNSAEMIKLDSKYFRFSYGIFNIYSYLVDNTLQKYMNKNLNIAKLKKIGNRGLMKAIDNYNAVYDIEFVSYASLWIDLEIERYVNNYSHTVLDSIKNFIINNIYKFIQKIHLKQNVQDVSENAELMDNIPNEQDIVNIDNKDEEPLVIDKQNTTKEELTEIANFINNLKFSNNNLSFNEEVSTKEINDIDASLNINDFTSMKRG